MADTGKLDAHIPPQGSGPIYRRLWRGYGALAIVALLLILMAALIPTMDTEEMPSSAEQETENGAAPVVTEVTS